MKHLARVLASSSLFGLLCFIVDCHLPFPSQAKGYPDISTRSFLHRLCASSSTLPVYALTDYDPDGIAVMSTYKHGSWNLSHESAELVVPRIEWLGIRSGDLFDGHEEGLLTLSARDRRKAMKMLENSVVLREEGEEREWRRELQVMLTIGMKGEMEVLAAKEDGVAGWVEGRLLQCGNFAMEYSGREFEDMLI